MSWNKFIYPSVCIHSLTIDAELRTLNGIVFARLTLRSPCISFGIKKIHILTCSKVFFVLQTIPKMALASWFGLEKDEKLSISNYNLEHTILLIKH